MIENGISQPEMLKKLNSTARKHIEILANDKNIKYIEKANEDL